MSINRVMISGNLTRDAELRTTPSGTSILNFGVAVNDRRRTQTGEWEDYANFIDCTMFGRRAEGLAPYLKKGVKVAIEGRLHYSSWEDRNSGQRRSKVDVTVDELEFMSSRNSGGNGQSYDAGQQGSYASQNAGGQAAYGQSNYGAQPSGNQGYAQQNQYGGGMGGSEGYRNNNTSFQQPQGNVMAEPPVPSAYDDSDIPF